jgi:glycosyltransferase involved in cell wall biosynthesis
MRALFVAPVPPPLNGGSLPVKVLHAALGVDHDIHVVNLNKNSLVSGVSSFGRMLDVLSIFRQVWARHRKNDTVYLTVSESLAGNLRDLVIYLICFRRIDTVVIHMLGGAGMNNILNRQRSLRRLANKFFIRRLGAIIVEGKTQCDMFAAVAERSRIHIIPNFAEDDLFVSHDSVVRKFAETDPLRILFLSNMLYGKGHCELLEAYLGLDEDVREHVVVDFAGEFASDADRRRFLGMIEAKRGIKYHGSVSGAQKRDLYANAHVFCLPTYYPYEGQPFSIVEAYASGCVVITTDHSGIRNIFADERNGFEVEKRSVRSLALGIMKAVTRRNALCSIALENLKQAERYHTRSTFLASMTSVLLSFDRSRGPR